MGAELTLGAEEELHLVDLRTRKLAAAAPQLLSRLPDEWYSAELQRTTIETNTPVMDTLAGLREELLRLRKGLVEVAAAEGVGVAAVGTAPRSAFAADFELTANGRYGRMQQQYRLLVDEQLICGTQIHVGVSDRDLAVEIAQRVARDLAVLLALSASSPYWNGHDTGYASIRTIIWQRWPSTGTLPPMGSAAEYDALVADLVRSGVIADAKMAYFDIRPSSHVPTLELRVCDACPLVDDAILIAGLFRAAVRAAEQDIEAGVPYERSPGTMHRAASWQAARSGLSSMLLDAGLHPEPVPAAEAVRALVRRLRPQLEELGDHEEVSELAESVLARGNSADRQRAAYAERGSLDDVVDLVLEETSGPPGGQPPAVSALRTYPARAGDEAISMGSRPRPAYADVIGHYRQLGWDELGHHIAERDAFARRTGLAFVVAGGQQAFDVDLVPRIVQAHEWRSLSAGLAQRARALEAFLQDVYGEQRVVADGILPEDAVQQRPGWREEATRIPQGVVRAPVMGFDVVRNELGGWRVLEDNLRNPSGLAYAVAARETLDAVVPDLPRPPGLLDPRDALPALAETLRAASPTDGVLVLLSSGPGSGAWYEHQRLATDGGLVLAGADDIEVAGGEVRLRESGERVAALYLRLDDELVDLTDSAGSPLGQRVMDVAARGGVLLANAPGNGLADDKAMYCYVPELISYYLGERPLLESVPTYRTSDATERRIVLERVGELVTKPVDGHGGTGVLVGPYASAADVLDRRAAIVASPDDFVAQEMVQLSSHPTFHGGTMQPRHVDLRLFAHVRGTDARDVTVLPVGLTRVAGPGSLIVNSSQGGGGKDTWIIGTDERSR